jgi:hypothetical protein
LSKGWWIKEKLRTKVNFSRSSGRQGRGVVGPNLRFLPIQPLMKIRCFKMVHIPEFVFSGIQHNDAEKIYTGQ